MAYLGSAPASKRTELDANTVETGDLKDGAVTVGKLASALDLSSKTVTLPSSTGAAKLASSNWVVEEVSGVLHFKYGGTTKATLNSSGNLVVVGDVTAFGTV